MSRAKKTGVVAVTSLLAVGMNAYADDPTEWGGTWSDDGTGPPPSGDGFPVDGLIVIDNTDESNSQDNTNTTIAGLDGDSPTPTPTPTPDPDPIPAGPPDPFAGLVDPPEGEWTIYVQYGSSGISNSGSGTLILDVGNETITFNVTDFPGGGDSFAFNSEQVNFEGDPDFLPFDADGGGGNEIRADDLEGSDAFAAGGGGFDGSWDLDGITAGFNSGDFVTGEPTSIADIQNLNAGDVTANYTRRGLQPRLRRDRHHRRLRRASNGRARSAVRQRASMDCRLSPHREIWSARTSRVTSPARRSPRVV